MNRYYNIGNSVDWKSKQVNHTNCLWNPFPIMPMGGHLFLTTLLYVSYHLDLTQPVMLCPHLILQPTILLGRSAIIRPRPPSPQLL